MADPRTRPITVPDWLLWPRVPTELESRPVPVDFCTGQPHGHRHQVHPYRPRLQAQHHSPRYRGCLCELRSKAYHRGLGARSALWIQVPVSTQWTQALDLVSMEPAPCWPLWTQALGPPTCWPRHQTCPPADPDTRSTYQRMPTGNPHRISEWAGCWRAFSAKTSL